MTFTTKTMLPISAVTTLARLQDRYACGPCVALDGSQRAMLEAFDALYPGEKLRILHGALNAGRLYLAGAEVMAYAQQTVGKEEAAFAFE